MAKKPIIEKETFKYLIELAYKFLRSNYYPECSLEDAPIKPGDLDCGYDCHTHEKYGFVPEADCPVHDVPGEKEGKDEYQNKET